MPAGCTPVHPEPYASGLHHCTYTWTGTLCLCQRAALDQRFSGVVPHAGRLDPAGGQALVSVRLQAKAVAGRQNVRQAGSSKQATASRQ